MHARVVRLQANVLTVRLQEAVLDMQDLNLEMEEIMAVRDELVQHRINAQAESLRRGLRPPLRKPRAHERERDGRKK